MWNIYFKNYLIVKADKNRTVLLFFHSFNSPFQQFKYYLNLTGKQQTQWPFKLFFHTFSPSILSPLPLHPCLSLSSPPSLSIPVSPYPPIHLSSSPSVCPAGRSLLSSGPPVRARGPGSQNKGGENVLYTAGTIASRPVKDFWQGAG